MPPARRGCRIALLLGGLTAACAGPSRPPPTSVVPRAPVQDLRVAVGEDPFLRGSPPAPNLGLLAAGPNPGIFETLTRLTPSFGLAPGLALRWEAPSPRQWRFVLRDGVTFHDGRPLDAEAVVASLDRIARRQAPPRGLVPGAATARGGRVVEVALSEPNARLPEQLAGPAMGIQAPGTQAGGGKDPSGVPTGTGPFRFVAYTPGAELRVRAYERYWGRRPSLASITFRFGAERDASRLLATRQVEAVGLVADDALAAVSGRTDRRVSSPPARAAYLLLNVGGIEPWATLKEDAVRRAVALALDQEALAEAGWPEGGEPNATLVPELVLGTAAAQVHGAGPDLERARQLLDEAGWAPAADGTRARGGRRLVLSLLLSRPADQARAAEVVRSQLARAGIAVEVADVGADPLAAFARVNQAAFDLFFDTRYQDDANPCSLCRFFSVRPGAQLSVAGAVAAGPRADELFDRVHEARSVEAARRVAAQLMQVVVADRVVAVPLATLRTTWLVSSRVRGFEPSPLPGAQRWDQVWLSL